MENRNEYHIKECTSCEGEGSIKVNADCSQWEGPPEYDICDDCNGSGYADHGEVCCYCHELLKGHTVEDGKEAAHFACYEKHNVEE